MRLFHTVMECAAPPDKEIADAVQAMCGHYDFTHAVLVALDDDPSTSTGTVTATMLCCHRMLVIGVIAPLLTMRCS